MINTTKTIYRKIDGWRGYLEPINAIAGCNYTGMSEDSPCPSDVAEAEIQSFIKKLRKEKIKYRTTWGNSSNVFMHKKFVCVSPEDRKKAQHLAWEHEQETRLFYEI